MHVTFRYLLLLIIVSSLFYTILPKPSADEVSFAQDRPANTIIIGTTDMPIQLDTATSYDFRSWEVLGHLYVGLTRQVSGSTYELALAETHAISDDGLTHTFTIRSDARFNDGTPITAQTFADSINRVIRLNNQGSLALRDIVTSVTAVDATTLVFTLAVPIPYFEALVSLPPFYPLHPQDSPAESIHTDFATLIGNGVYILDDWIPGNTIQLRANPNYAFGEPAKTEHIIIRGYAGTLALRQALENHEIDIAWQDLYLQDTIEVINTIPEIQLIKTPSARQWYMVLNRRYSDIGTSPEFTIDNVVRESFILMVDREQIVQDYFQGYVDVAYGLIPPFLGDAYLPVWQYEADYNAGLRKLADANYRISNRAMIEITTSQGYGFSTGGIVEIRDIFSTTIELIVTVNSDVGMSAFITSLERGSNMISAFPFTPIVLHPDAYLRPLLYSGNELSARNRYSNERIDTLLDEAAMTTDLAIQNDRYHEVQAFYAPVFGNPTDDHNLIFPLWQESLLLLHWNDIIGITVEPNSYLHYNLLERQ